MRFSGLHLTFLGKFAIVTFALAMLVTLGLRTLLVNKHRDAVVNNQAQSAARQIGEFVTDRAVRYPENPGRLNATFARIEVAANRIPDVAAIRIYRANGAGVYPARLPAATAQIAAVLQNGVRSEQRGDVRTDFIPFRSGSALDVIAIDLSLSEIRAQLNPEERYVTFATSISIALIFFSLLSLAAGASSELERRRRESERTFVQTLGALAQTIEKRDPYTAGHSRRVAEYSGRLSDALGLGSRMREIITSAALLHDLGKIGVADAILNKTGTLDANEYGQIKCHPQIGADILSGIQSMEDIVPCVLHHHERVDGTGYPANLGHLAIPVGSRVIAVADAFDAMTTSRPYREALPIGVAVSELLRVAGTQLDAEYVEAFIAMIFRDELPLVQAPATAADDTLTPA